VVRTDAAAGAAKIDTRSAAETTATTSDRERAADGTFESLWDALWAPLAEPSKTRASSLPDAAHRAQRRWMDRTEVGRGAAWMGNWFHGAGARPVSDRELGDPESKGRGLPCG
jgi:hypothetical protein